MESLTKNSIMSKVYFDPVHLTEFYRKMGHKESELPVTEDIAKRVLTLPMYPGMLHGECKEIVDTIEKASEVGDAL